MAKKLLSIMIKGLNGLTDVKFVLGVIAGYGATAIMLGHAVNLF